MVQAVTRAEKGSSVICGILHVFPACSVRRLDTHVQWESAERKKERRAARNQETEKREGD